MGDDWIQHIGADQLISGLPKHMEAVAGDGENTYWEIVPDENACATCRSLRGMRFERNPVPVHPNCACAVRRVPPPERQKGVVAYGFLQGYEAQETERFEAGQKITVEIRNLGPFLAGVRMRVDQEKEQSTGHMRPGKVMYFEFSKFREHPVPWEVFLICVGGDNSTIRYFIRG